MNLGKKQKDQKKIEEKNTKKINSAEEKNAEKQGMSFQKHFAELRQRIIFCTFFFLCSFLICYFFSKEIYNFLLQPLIDISQNNPHRKLIYTSPAEAFIAYLKTSLYAAMFFSLPIFLAEIYLFLSPALYKKEKKNILITFFFVPFFFLFGASFAYKFILPLALKFFLGFENQGLATVDNIPIYLETKISEYLSFVKNLLFGFGISFQLPILLLFLIRVGCLSVNDLKQKRRYWIVIIFLMAAILTPPDAVSQISLAILLSLLFEIVILISTNFNNKK
jgi:sec-independent protein translocase protein TatC